jgi:hypothetical protein
MNHNDILRTVLVEGSDPVILQTSGWLSHELSADELESKYENFNHSFQEAVGQFTEILGAPVRTHTQDHAWLASWYPEAMQFAAWKSEAGLIALALEHQDREAPILLLVSHLTEQEIAERMEP